MENVNVLIEDLDRRISSRKHEILILEHSRDILHVVAELESIAKEFNDTGVVVVFAEQIVRKLEELF